MKIKRYGWRVERGSEENGVRMQMVNEEKYRRVGKEREENIRGGKRDE